MVEAGINNFKMEMLGGSKGGGREVEKEKNMKEDGDNGEKDKREKDNEKEEDNKHKEQKDKKDKKEEKVRKVKAQFHQQECSSPRLTLPCSGSNWCNILCAGAQHQHQEQNQQNFLSEGTSCEILKSPKLPQFNGAFQLEEDSDVYKANKSCNLWIPSYEFQRGPIPNVEFLLDEGFKPKHSENSGDVPICGPGDRNTENMEEVEDGSGKQEAGGLLYVTEV